MSSGEPHLKLALDRSPPTQGQSGPEQSRCIFSRAQEDEIRESYVREKISKYSQTLSITDIHTTSSALKSDASSELEGTTVSTSLSHNSDHFVLYIHDDKSECIAGESSPQENESQRSVEFDFGSERGQTVIQWSPNEKTRLNYCEQGTFEQLERGEIPASQTTCSNVQDSIALNADDLHRADSCASKVVTSLSLEEINGEGDFQSTGPGHIDCGTVNVENGSILLDDFSGLISVPLAGEPVSVDPERNNLERISTIGREPKCLQLRQVPNGCAICLSCYEAEERVTWSSNKNCNHVFHHKCILEWFVSLGKKQAAAHRESGPQHQLDQQENTAGHGSFILTSGTSGAAAGDITENRESEIRRITNFRMLSMLPSKFFSRESVWLTSIKLIGGKSRATRGPLTSARCFVVNYVQRSQLLASAGRTSLPFLVLSLSPMGTDAQNGSNAKISPLSTFRHS